MGGDGWLLGTNYLQWGFLPCVRQRKQLFVLGGNELGTKLPLPKFCWLAQDLAAVLRCCGAADPAFVPPGP
jgi:hypothetical protein